MASVLPCQCRKNEASVPRLPIVLYNSRFLARIGNVLGSMLKVNKLTSIHSRGRFARLCVELDFSHPLTMHIMVRSNLVYLEYEGLHVVCFKCGVYGHKQYQFNAEGCNMKVPYEDYVKEGTRFTPPS